jgi:hypothetical protein
MKAQARQGLTNKLRGLVHDVVSTLPIPHTQHATVISVQTAPSRVTVAFSGTAEHISGIRYPSWYTPTVGDTVICHKVGTDIYVDSHIQA